MNASLAIWLDASRPKTLPLALASIITGSALAFADGQFSWLIAGLSLLTAMLLQVLSNLANDYGDAVKGTDNAQRLGPIRAMQSGAVAPASMRAAIVVNVLLILVAGVSLISYALNTLEHIIIFIVLGLTAIVAAIAYTVGNRPYGYLGLGDASVFIFFGLLGVLGSYFLHTGTLTLSLLLPSCGCGLMAVAVLNVNNMRDIDNDAHCGKRTVAVRLGQHKAKQYHLLLLSAATLAFASYLLSHNHPMWLNILFVLCLFGILQHARAVWMATTPAHFAPMLPVMVKCALITHLLFAALITTPVVLSLMDAA